MQYLDIADAAEPGSSITAFMRLKVLLEQDNVGAAVNQITKLGADEEATMDVLLVSVHQECIHT